MFYVIGGEFTDTTFTIPKTEETFGPFDNYEEAYNIWKSRSWWTVDSCLTRYRIKEDI